MPLVTPDNRKAEVSLAQVRTLALGRLRAQGEHPWEGPKVTSDVKEDEEGQEDASSPSALVGPCTCSLLCYLGRQAQFVTPISLDFSNVSRQAGARLSRPFSSRIRLYADMETLEGFGGREE